MQSRNGWNKRKRSAGFKLNPESLEARNLLAGDVLVSVSSAGDLVIKGDADGNHVSVVSGEEGIHVIGNYDTSVWLEEVGDESSGYAVYVPAEEVTGKIIMDTRDGDDHVEVNGDFAQLSVAIITGNGNDNAIVGDYGGFARFAPGHTQIGNLEIDMGNDRDSAALFGSTITGNADVKLGFSNHGDHFVGYGGSVGNNLTIHTGSSAGDSYCGLGEYYGPGRETIMTDDAPYSLNENDNVFLQHQEIGGNLVITGNAGGQCVGAGGSQVEGNTTILLGSGNDQLALIETSLSGNLLGVMAAGDDTFNSYSLSIDGKASILGGQGDDSIAMTATYLNGAATILGGTNENQFYLNDVAVSNVLVGGGASADFVQLYGLQASGKSLILTGAGDDNVVVHDVEMNDDFTLFTGAGNDNVDLSNSAIASQTQITTGSGDDEVAVYQLGSDAFEGATIEADNASVNVVAENFGEHVGAFDSNGFHNLGGVDGTSIVNVSGVVAGANWHIDGGSQDFLEIYSPGGNTSLKAFPDSHAADLNDAGIRFSFTLPVAADIQVEFDHGFGNVYWELSNGMSDASTSGNGSYSSDAIRLEAGEYTITFGTQDGHNAASGAHIDNIVVSATMTGSFADGIFQSADPEIELVTNSFFPDGNAGDVHQVRFEPGSAVNLEGIRLQAASDGPTQSFRRSMSHFKLLADIDGDGEYETVLVDQTININYADVPNNEAEQSNHLDLTFQFDTVVAQSFMAEVTTGTSGTHSGVRVLELDAIGSPVDVGDGGMQIDTGTGADRLSVEASQLGATQVRMGGGKDVVFLRENAFGGNVDVALGFGSDEMVLEDHYGFYKSVSLRGGLGVDRVFAERGEESLEDISLRSMLFSEIRK